MPSEAEAFSRRGSIALPAHRAGAARAQEQGRELTPAESAAAEAYASAVTRESAAR